MWTCTRFILKYPRRSENLRSLLIFFRRLLPAALRPALRRPRISRSLPGISCCCIPKVRTSTTSLSKRISVSRRAGNSARLFQSLVNQQAKSTLLPYRSNGSSTRRCWRANTFWSFHSQQIRRTRSILRPTTRRIWKSVRSWLTHSSASSPKQSLCLARPTIRTTTFY